jgi:voltage-gated potassium channel
MKKLSFFWMIIKRTGMNKILSGFFLYYIVTSFLVLLFEPSIHTYRESLWYCFISFTTIGYGDYVAVTGVGRLLTIILTLYGVIVVAMIPAVVITYLNEQTKIKHKESLMLFLEQLKKLPTLSHEELVEISEKAKQAKL